jgi:hypothetical protein
MGKLMLENKLRMAAVVTTITCFGLGRVLRGWGGGAEKCILHHHASQTGTPRSEIVTV